MIDLRKAYRLQCTRFSEERRGPSGKFLSSFTPGETLQDQPCEMPSRVEIAYRDAIDNIMFAKRQQWAITNYAIAAYIGIFAVAQSIRDIQSVEQYLASFLLLCIFLYCCYVLNLAQRDLTRFRSRLTAIYRKYFGKEEREELELSALRREFHDGAGILVGLEAVAAIGALLVGYSIYRL